MSGSQNHPRDSTLIPKQYVLRLFVSGATPRSTKAIADIKAICERELSGRYTLEVIDLYKAPERAGQDGILAVPTLLKQLPDPVRRLIGDLSDERVLVGLGLRSKQAGS